MIESRSTCWIIAALLLGALLLGTAGCGNLGACRNICDRYAVCFDSDYDVDECIDRCVSRAREDVQYAEQVDVCDVCIERRSCTESFSCGGDCHKIVP